ncbi:MAG: ArsA family ATPase [Aminobacterium sp.]|jgi:arsenite-transporting ATPase|uniref:ArsA family ATPase n=1 Tax=unclassified Aminobacterium TaxID=2685012 RepID=UPI001BCFB83F|nr:MULTISPECIES: ArsA family ATPase [unclassified Aminobacterium]MDD2206945.1 ArsA family ATPase [Aminobacterium sp.]MDD3426662.1 ArsA family ATPase [Aminobacterium sp.]MDD3707250.1 ArsA family ATPase [Aminobacterium sp.]MDD4228584.1 ArsA family ATPase [Aminobacterium sp.]MDD4551440.1 ArsA family ATPase [Aminobacterium sp.]
MVYRVKRQFIFFGGKGGTGKTTCAAAYAYALSQQGVKTLVVSTDPAHSLADAFDHPIGLDVVRIEENLWGIEIDAEEEAKKYMKAIQDKMLHIVSAVIVDEIKRQIEIAYMSPGAEEAAIFDKFIELMESIGKPYDAIVFDTAPTGHTLRLLTLPEILGVWIEHLIEKRANAMELMKVAAKYDKELQEKIKEDPIIETLQKRRDKFTLARKILTDRENTAFYFVLNAEKLPIIETKRAIEILQKHNIGIGGVVVNKVIPEEAGPFFEKRRIAQEQYLLQIDELFGSLGVTHVPMLDSDIQGLEQLNQIGPFILKLDEI